MTLERLTYRFDGPLGPLGNVETVRLEEALDAPYLLELDLAIDAIEPDAAELLGRDAVLTMERRPLARRVCGVIRTVTEGERRPDGGVGLSLEVVPALWMLSLRRDTRMFQEQTVPEILERVLNDGLGPYGRAVRLELGGDYPRREYCLQYQESDLAFVQRLMEEEGIYYAFDHEGDTELLLLRDRNESAEPAPTAPADGLVTYHPDTLVVDTTEPIHRFFRDEASVTTAVTLRDFDWTSGAIVIEHAKDGADERGRVRESYEHGEGRALTIGDYDQGVRRYQQNDRERQGSVRQEAHGARALVGSGLGRVIGFAPGKRFRLVGHPGVGLDDEYLITRVVHRSEEATELAEEGGTETYHNRFECIPIAVPHRPARRTPKPRIPSMQTAIVTGAGGEEIHTDEWGRVKVQFHWDRENPPDDTSSAWVRVRQGWAGVGWGALWIPRVGVEVVVSFLDGDPDRPLVTGCLYNAQNPPPYDLPAEKTKSTIKSNSSPGGGGFNEVRYEDGAGREEIFIHAQKDTNAITNNCETNTVGVDQMISIGVNQSQTIGVNQTEGIGANQTLSVGANRVVTVGATFTETIAASSTITVNGHATETLDAGETQTVNAGRTETVNGGETRTVNGGQTETINGGVTQTIVGGITQSIVGAVAETFDGAHTNDTTGSLTHTILGGSTTLTPASYDLTALGGYNLICPAGGFIMAPGGWKVVAPAQQLWIESTIMKAAGSFFAVEANTLDIFGLKGTATGVKLSATGVAATFQAVKGYSKALWNPINGPAAKTSGARIVLTGVVVQIAGAHLFI